MKLLITGGHLTPALAFIDYLQLEHSDVTLVFVGRLYARKKSKQPAHEKEEVEKRNIPFFAFDSGKLITAHPFFQFFHLILLFVTIPKAFFLILQTKPTTIVSFGGYLGVPIAISAWLLRTPIVIHEQTRGFGLANRCIGLLAKKIALSHRESLAFVPKSKSTVVGNPMRQVLLKPNPVKPKWLPAVIEKPILYITGGSQGSEIINATIQQILEPITKHWLVIHQCGASSEERNYFQELSLASNRLKQSAQKRYCIQEWISDEDLAWIYRNTKLVISRSGANTVDELIQFALPAILIPLPFSHQEEQKQNGEAMKNLGGAVIIEQKQLSPQLLLNTIDHTKQQLAEMKARLQHTAKPPNSCALIFKLVQDVQ